MPWGAVAGAVVGAVANNVLAPNQSGGGGSSQQYIPTGLSSADTGWQTDFAAQQGLASGVAGVAQPAYQQSYDAAGRINYDPYLQGANQAGQMYGQLGQAAGQQMSAYGTAAQQAQGQQSQLYGAGQQVLNTAMDPQNALYDRTAQQVQDQVRAGQAARGLGNSAQGSGEENQAMSNFNIDWQNNQLQRQATGLQADVNANSAGVNQGRLYGADQSAALAAGAAGAGYYGQAGQVPTAAQQYVAGQPAANAGAYASEMAGVQQLYGNAQAGAIPYMNFGNGALQTNWQNNYTTNRDAAAGAGQIGSAIGQGVQNNWGSIGDWFSGGSTGGASPGTGGYVDPSTGASYNNPSAYTAPGYDYSGTYIGG